MSLQHSPDTLARFKQPTSKGRGGQGKGGEERLKGRKGREGKGQREMEGSGRVRKERKGKGRSGAYFFPL